MTIQTTLDIDQDAYVMHNNKVKQVTVEEIRVQVMNDRISISESIVYTVYGSSLTYDESKIFPTKEDLLKSL